MNTTEKAVTEQREATVGREQVRTNLLAWIAALRSGKYSQCIAKLHDQRGGYCCLGVALEVRGVEWSAGKTAAMTPTGNGHHTGPLLAGLNDDNLNLFGLSMSEHGQLTAMNDDGNHDFASIADYIEREILPRYTD